MRLSRQASSYKSSAPIEADGAKLEIMTLGGRRTQAENCNLSCHVSSQHSPGKRSFVMQVLSECKSGILSKIPEDILLRALLTLRRCVSGFGSMRYWDAMGENIACLWVVQRRRETG